MPRNHRLRERRLKLGLSQAAVGYLAEIARWPGQVVGLIERGERPDHGSAVRRALIWMEQEPRRQRAWERQEAAAAAEVERVLVSPESPEGDAVLVDRLVDLLHQGRCDDFDALAARLSGNEALVNLAGERYLDECTPVNLEPSGPVG